jgi:hypothetical protein
MSDTDDSSIDPMKIGGSKGVHPGFLKYRSFDCVGNGIL